MHQSLKREHLDLSHTQLYFEVGRLSLRLNNSPLECYQVPEGTPQPLHLVLDVVFPFGIHNTIDRPELELTNVFLCSSLAVLFVVLSP
jgi:hypothetical protein